MLMRRLSAAAMCLMLAAWIAAPAAQPLGATAGPTQELARNAGKLLAGREGPPDEPWSFAVAADTHIQYYDVTHSDRLAQLLGSWIGAKVDFGVIVGDLGGPGHHEPFGRQIVRTVGCPPILVAIGNHEMDRGGKKAWLDAMYPGVLSVEGKLNDRPIYYSMDYRGCHFVFLDGDFIVGKKWYSDEISLAQLKWLEQDLQAHRGKLTFLFTHHPIEYSQEGQGYCVLFNRGRVVVLLRRFPDVQWVFQGHLHYDELVRLWGLNSVHVFREPLAVRVRGQQAELCRITAAGLVPCAEKEWNELGRRMTGRWGREGDRDALWIAEQTIEPSDAHARMAVQADKAVGPTRGPTMLKFSRTANVGDRDSGQAMQLVLANSEFVPVVRGMEFAYDVRFEASAHDEVALHLEVSQPVSSGASAALADQTGLRMQAIKTGKWTFRAEPLRGRADGRWFARRCDLSSLAGGWIDRILLVTRVPMPAADGLGTVNLYLDNIRFIWPAGVTAADPSTTTAPASP